MSDFKPTTPVAKRLEGLAALFEEKNKQYGDAYKRFGHILTALYPNGKMIRTVADWNEMACLINVIANLNRHAAGEPSADNLGDMAVYIAMLEDVAIEKAAFQAKEIPDEDWEVIRAREKWQNLTDEERQRINQVARSSIPSLSPQAEAFYRNR